VLARLAAPPQLTLLPTGAGEVMRLERGNVEQIGDAGWFPDGKRIIFNGREPGGQTRCYAQEIGGGAARAITPAGVAATSPVLVSPDGRYVVAAGAQGRRALYPVEGGEPRPVPNLSDDDLIARFSEDGRALLVYSRGEQPVRINRLDLSTGGKEQLREVAPADPSGILDAPRVFVTPDGKAYVYFMRRLLCDLHLVEGLK
jgi:Tol biopolymer transport system component